MLLLSTPVLQIRTSRPQLCHHDTTFLETGLHLCVHNHQCVRNHQRIHQAHQYVVLVNASLDRIGFAASTPTVESCFSFSARTNASKKLMMSSRTAMAMWLKTWCRRHLMKLRMSWCALHAVSVRSDLSAASFSHCQLRWVYALIIVSSLPRCSCIS